MEVRIRMQKTGKSVSKLNNYRIVVIGRNKARQAKNLEILGYYEPAKKPVVLKVDQARLDAWVKKGAQMTDSVRTLIKKADKAVKY